MMRGKPFRVPRRNLCLKTSAAARLEQRSFPEIRESATCLFRQGTAACYGLRFFLLSNSGRDTPLPHLGGDFSVSFLGCGHEQLSHKGSHSVVSIHLNLVWITGYRKKILSGETAQRARALIRGICEKHQVAILKGHIAPDHSHLSNRFDSSERSNL